MAKPGAEVRLVSLAPQCRFHPKLYCVWSSSTREACVSAIGSGNMTQHGLSRNGEAAVILTAETAAEALTLREQWQRMWDMGRQADQQGIDEYRDRYQKGRKQRLKLARLGIAPAEPEAAAPPDPLPGMDSGSSATETAWLDAGSASALGKDLEFPRAMVPFFALSGSPEKKMFRLQDGRLFRLTFTERKDNAMWRLMFSSEAIEAATGRQTMRPVTGGNRSDLAVVFSRSADDGRDYDVHMVLLGSPDYTDLKTRSKAEGKLYRTRGKTPRNFGFFTGGWSPGKGHV